MITFTDQASAKVAQNLAKRGKGVGIRIGVRTTGCSGLSYTLEYVDSYDYEVGVTNYGQNKFVVLVNKEHEPYLAGLTVDYMRKGLNEGFEFINPNERDKCGCGESFRV